MSFRTSKCTHGEKGMCIHCMVNRQKQEKINSVAKVQADQQKCKHAAHMKCLRCLGSGQSRELCNHPDYETCAKCQHFLKYDKFSYFIDTLLSQCSHKKPCGKCLPPLSRKTFFIDKDCKKHLPYPQALCESCMAPTVTIGPQRYSHVNRVIIRTKDILYTIVDSKHIGILLGRIIDETVFVQGVYYPPQQQPSANYLDPNSIPDRSYIFSSFDLKEVGIVYRSAEVSGLNLMMSSLLQERYLEFEGQHSLSRFVTMRLQLQGEEPHFQCFMVTDQFQAFHRNGLIYEKQTAEASFDLITARSQSTTAKLPTFLRQGIQTNHILFKQCIIWIPTIHQHQFCIDQQYIYPFFTIQNQTLHHLRSIIEQPQETLQKYRNIQFLLHLQSLIGRKQTQRFLKDYYFDEPDLFLQNVLEKKDKQEQQNVMNKFQNTSQMLRYYEP